MSEYGRYKAEDLIRYHRNEMSETEKHALERAALEDPFLEEALEGYAQQPSEKDLSAVRQIASRKRDNVVPITMGERSKFNAGRIAAVVVAAIGLAIVFILVNGKDESPTLADNNSASVQKLEQVTAKADSTATVVNINRDQKSATRNTTEAEPVESVTSASTQAAPLPQDVSPAVTDDDAVANANQEIRSATEDKSVGTVGEREEDRRKEAAKKYLRADTLGRSNAELSAISVQAPNTRAMKRSENGYASAKSDAAAGAVVIKDAEENAFKRLQFYLVTEAKKLKVFDPALQGNVKLGFDTDAIGAATNILIEQEKCSACAEKAVELLKNAPMRLAPDLKGQKVEIEF